jgi:hypothetical protein
MADKSKSFTMSRVWRGGALVGAARAAAPQATLLGAELLRSRVLEQSPVETNFMREQTTARQSGDDAQLVVDTAYAAAQEVHDDYPHTPGNAGQPAGRAHNVELSMKENSREIYGVMAKVLRNAIAGAS